jgi:hypothetical protein
MPHLAQTYGLVVFGVGSGQRGALLAMGVPMKWLLRFLRGTDVLLLSKTGKRMMIGGRVFNLGICKLRWLHGPVVLVAWRRLLRCTLSSFGGGVAVVKFVFACS